MNSFYYIMLFMSTDKGLQFISGCDFFGGNALFRYCLLHV